jgi:electron-transferring-flavoprotein dehydrogenase
MTARPADYRPAIGPAEFIGEPSAPADERIDVGVCVVGGGPAGLAAAVRLGQLVHERPEVGERLGDVPVCVLEKGRGPGSHLLSGAVINPRALRALFPGMSASEMPFLGPVEGESVWFLTPRRAIKLPAPPTMWNHGNHIASLSQVGRWLAEKAEELGVTIVPETAATKLLVSSGRVVGVRTGDKGLGKDGEPLPNHEPGSDVRARCTILAEGTIGHLSLALIERFGLRDQPQTWALGVKEVWEVQRPLHGIVHTMGWPLRGAKRHREFGGSFIYPMGEGMVTIGMVVGLDYTDATLSVHDLLQELKTHPFVRKILEGGRRIAWGAKTIPEGGLQALPRRLHVPGALVTGDAAGFVNVPALKGVHYAMRSGMLAAETAFDAVSPGRTAWEPGALESYDAAVRGSFIWKDLALVRNMRPAFRSGFMGGLVRAGVALNTLGKVPPGNVAIHADADSPVVVGDRARRYPKPDGVLTFDKLSSVFLSGNQTRDDMPSHIRVRHDVPREVAEAWVHMCPAQVYEIVSGASAGGTVRVEVTHTNCVQCGAITAKGGRLTPPEGGTGPDYQVT